MYRITIVKLLLLVTLFVLLSCSVGGQELQSKLAQRIKAFDSESPSTVGQLIDFARRFEIPMGIEWVDKPGESLAPSIHARNTTPQRILQQIIHKDPGNGFILNSGVVHVFSSSLLNDRRNFLNLRLSHFQVKNESLFGAEFLLRIGIHDVVNPNPGGYGGGHGHGVPRSDAFDVRNLTLSFNNATIRQILNSIAARQGNALWLVRIKSSEMMANGRFYAQTTSPTSKEPAPDFHWDFIPLIDLTK